MELKYCPVNKVERVFAETKEHNIDCELMLPDYCPAIVKILACSMECFNENTSVLGDKLNAEAYASIRLLYVGEENKISVFSQEVGFSKSVIYPEVSENDILTVTHRNIGLSTRVTGQRRVEVHAVTAVTFEVNRVDICNFVCGTDDDSLECRTTEASYFDISAYVSESFEVRELCSEQLSGEDNLQIIRKNSIIICNEYKTVKNKLMIKGICETQIAYTGDGENISLIKNNIPFTNVFDVSGVRDTDECFISLFCENIRLVKTESGGSISYEVCVKVRIEAKTGKKTELNLVTDAYSRHADMVIVPLEQNVCRNVMNCDKTISVEATVDGYEDKFTQIEDCWTEKIGYEYSIEDSIIKIRGSVVLMAIVRTERNEHLCVMRNSSFEASLNAHTNSVLSAELSKNTMSAAILPDGGISFKVELRILGYISENAEIKGVSAVEFSNEEASTSVTASAITVYFADEGEILWDIAKKNNTTVSLIKKFNENTDDTIGERRVLILPSY